MSVRINENGHEVFDGSTVLESPRFCVGGLSHVPAYLLSGPQYLLLSFLTFVWIRFPIPKTSKNHPIRKISWTSALTAQSFHVSTGLLPRAKVESTNSKGSLAPRWSMATLIPLEKPSS